MVFIPIAKTFQVKKMLKGNKNVKNMPYSKIFPLN